MSTRANIIIKDSYCKLIFYRHSDGYPEGILPSLEKLIDWIKKGLIRNNVSQGAGWLVLLGAMEYKTLKPESFKCDERTEYGSNLDYEIKGEPTGWKVGAFEPTTEVHGDIKYLYIVDFEKLTIKTISNRNDFQNKWETCI